MESLHVYIGIYEGISAVQKLFWLKMHDLDTPLNGSSVTDIMDSEFVFSRLSCGTKIMGVAARKSV